MKHILCYFYFILILSITMSAQTKLQSIEGQILELKNKFASDKRTAIFNINVSETADGLVLTGETNLPDAKNSLLKSLSEIQIKDEINVLPEEKLGDKIFGVVNLSVANIRAKSEHSAEMATQALLGSIVKVYKKGDDGWYLVQTPDNYISWVDGDALQLVNQQDAELWKNSDKIIFTQSYGSAFENSTGENGLVSDLVFGDLVKLISSNGDYYQVEFPDRRKANLKKSEGELFTEWLKSRSCTKDNILTTAKKFMGVPYLWGGTSAKGLDCSGFTKTVFFANGVVLPRDASQQVFVGENVDTENDFSNLQPGDLMFFGTAGNQLKTERITHVAIYLGDGEFIHAAGRVRINSINKVKSNFSKHRLTTFIRAKRIITSLNQNGVQTIDSNPFYK